MFLSKSGNGNEQDLILQYKATGNLDVLGHLFMPYSSLVYGVCLKYLKDRDEAKDAVVHIFEKLIQSLKDHEVTNFKSWLYVLAKNHSLMYLRAQKGKFMEDISEPFMENALVLHPVEEPELEQNLSRLEKCIETLADDQKQCVQLFFLKEKCYKEITGLTGFELNKVKSFIQNGKRNLKICMERNG